MRPPLLTHTPEELTVRLKGPGRARLIFKLLSKGLDPFTSDDLSTGARERLKEACTPTPFKILSRSVATDKTTKLLLEMSDGAGVETVVIPSSDRTTLCVSSQVGCARGCDFCLTATMGLKRNLGCDEILVQVLAGIAHARESGFPEVRNIVYMGMGEPLDNLKEVERSLLILCDDRGFGFGARHITVSTVGTHRAAIEQAATWPARLAWSLHAAVDSVRKDLIATAKADPIEIRDWFLSSIGRDPLFVECVLIDGVNDRDQDLAMCVELFAGLDQEIRINLLPLNLIGRPDLRPSPMARVLEFRNALRVAGHVCIIRRPRGQEEGAACGQLAVIQN